MNDPTAVEPKAGQIYENARRGELYQLLYVDDQIVLMRSEEEKSHGDNGHRIERRVHFNNQIDHDFMEHRPESSLDMLTEHVAEWAEVSYIGETTEQALYDAGYETTLELQQADDDELLAVSGVGQKGLINLREFSR